MNQVTFHWITAIKDWFPTCSWSNCYGSISAHRCFAWYHLGRGVQFACCKMKYPCTRKRPELWLKKHQPYGNVSGTQISGSTCPKTVYQSLYGDNTSINANVFFLVNADFNLPIEFPARIPFLMLFLTMKSSSIMSTCWRVTWELRHFSVSPFLAKVFLHQSPIESSLSRGVLMYRESRESSWKKRGGGQPVANSTQNALTWMRSVSVMMRATSRRVSLLKSSPVISQSIQTSLSVIFRFAK